MIDFAERSQKIAKDRTRNDFETNDMFRYALIYIVQTIGEAAAQVSHEIREGNRHIPWRYIIATRNILVHEFDGIDNNVVWQIVVSELPELIAQLKQVKLNAK
ncbi:MAG: DUF86 domain-containing protein [Alphaproteobacteria bacterium]|nr:DUF86 domain-containing protein [Alphaproteobacteria bacterium]